MLTVKLSNSIQNIKQLNGWNYNNEKIYNSLTWKQKEALHILIIEQFKFFSKKDRLTFSNLINYVKYNENVVNISDEIIARNQHFKLMDEVHRIINDKK